MDARQFIVTQQLASSALPEASTTFTIQYQPTILGSARSIATITNIDSDRDESSFTLILVGNVIEIVEIIDSPENEELKGGSAEIFWLLLLTFVSTMRALSVKFLRQSKLTHN